MKLSSPSLIEIEDGEYARGKKIQVVRRTQIEREMRPVLEALIFLERIQKPGDRLDFSCIATQIEDTKMLYCGTFLERR